jgi:hypothetical protein
MVQKGGMAFLKCGLFCLFFLSVVIHVARVNRPENSDNNRCNRKERECDDCIDDVIEVLLDNGHAAKEISGQGKTEDPEGSTNYIVRKEPAVVHFSNTGKEWCEGP